MNALALVTSIASASLNLGVLTLCSCLGLILARPAHADVVSLLGDKDCFGVPGAASCPAGSLFVGDLGGTFFADYRTPTDPAFTDIWSTPGGVSYTHMYVLP